MHDKGLPILHNQYNGCWCSLCQQGSSNNDIDLVKPGWLGPSTLRVSSKNNTGKWMMIFVCFHHLLLWTNIHTAFVKHLSCVLREATFLVCAYILFLFCTQMYDLLAMLNEAKAQHIKAEMKWPTFCAHHVQLWMECLYIDKNVVTWCFQWFYWQKFNIGPANGSTRNRRQAIIWTHDD